MREPDGGTIDAATWTRLLGGDRGCAPPALYAPLLGARASAGRLAIGRIAQSLDGRIATPSGGSFWISGPADILHTHRLRALCDAVLVGAGTVRADDPLLTTRACDGPSPVRVVIDPERRLASHHRVFGPGPATLLLCAEDARGPERLGCAEILPVARATGEGLGGLDGVAVLDTLARRGLDLVLVEGGGLTVSRFLAAGALDRLHVTVAPLLLGQGVPSFTLPCPAEPDDGMRLDWTLHRLGDDVLFDIAVHRARPPMCR